jgi:putative ABC transport system permease protein
MTTTLLDTPIIRGKKSLTQDEVSLDEDFSKRIGLDIGDRVTFLLSGRDVTFTIANIRKSQREGFRPFFYFSFDQSALARAPKTYFAATYASDLESWKR